MSLSSSFAFFASTRIADFSWVLHSLTAELPIFACYREAEGCRKRAEIGETTTNRAIGTFENRESRTQGRRLKAWRDSSARFRRDPSLVVLFDFEQVSWVDRVLRNLAPGAIADDAAVVGCGKAEGRWLGKGAIEFRNLSDRVRVRVPGTHESLTLATWVRVDRLEGRFNSLFMTDAFELGAVHWQIRGNGSLHLAVSGPANEPATNYNYDSPGIFTTERLGQWTHLAMVLDGSRGQMIHYVDGQPVGRFALSKEVALHIEHGELGNWNPGNSSDRAPIRYLSGRMDEFAMFGRALSDQEIIDVYKAGSPEPRTP